MTSFSYLELRLHSLFSFHAPNFANEIKQPPEKLYVAEIDVFIYSRDAIRVGEAGQGYAVSTTPWMEEVLAQGWAKVE